jgi:hypothetical protein
VDTNVAVAANRTSPQASFACVTECIRVLNDICRGHILVIDDSWHILREYQQELRSEGQPGIGDAFLKWVLTNRNNLYHCVQVHITPSDDSQEPIDFEEFPDDPALYKFDPADRKFVAVAIVHSEHPRILNATDSDWWYYKDVLAKHGVKVDFVCPDAPYII